MVVGDVANGECEKGEQCQCGELKRGHIDAEATMHRGAQQQPTQVSELVQQRTVVAEVAQDVGQGRKEADGMSAAGQSVHVSGLRSRAGKRRRLAKAKQLWRIVQVRAAFGSWQHRHMLRRTMVTKLSSTGKKHAWGV